MRPPPNADFYRLSPLQEGMLFESLQHGHPPGARLVDRQVVPQTFEPEWLADLELGYRFGRLTAAIGAQNLFDTFPDRNLDANSNLGIFTYPSHSPFGMNGRFVYTRVSYTF